MMNGFEVTIDEVKARMESGDSLFFVNVLHHQDRDWAVMKVRGAVRVPDNEVEMHLNEIPRDRTIIVYSTCPGNEQSIRVVQILQQHGWSDAHPLIGGFNVYLDAGLPVEEIGRGNKTLDIMGL